MRLVSKELRIPSAMSNMFLVEKFVEEICDSYYISNSYYGNILLAIEEAVKNAIVHGNQLDSGKEVVIRFLAKPVGLSFSISDQGNGFNYHSIPNPLDLDDRAAESAGKGIFLIRTLADETYYNTKGNNIEIVFRISSINRDTAIDRAAKLSGYFASIKTTVN